jgi:hypothetical protein
VSNLRLSREEQEAFLAGTHYAVIGVWRSRDYKKALGT